MARQKRPRWRRGWRPASTWRGCQAARWPASSRSGRSPCSLAALASARRSGARRMAAPAATLSPGPAVSCSPAFAYSDQSPEPASSHGTLGAYGGRCELRVRPRLCRQRRTAHARMPLAALVNGGFCWEAPGTSRKDPGPAGTANDPPSRGNWQAPLQPALCTDLHAHAARAPGCVGPCRRERRPGLLRCRDDRPGSDTDDVGPGNAAKNPSPGSSTRFTDDIRPRYAPTPSRLSRRRGPVPPQSTSTVPRGILALGKTSPDGPSRSVIVREGTHSVKA